MTMLTSAKTITNARGIMSLNLFVSTSPLSNAVSRALTVRCIDLDMKEMVTHQWTSLCLSPASINFYGIAVPQYSDLLSKVFTDRVRMCGCGAGRHRRMLANLMSTYAACVEYARKVESGANVNIDPSFRPMLYYITYVSAAVQKEFLTLGNININ